MDSVSRTPFDRYAPLKATRAFLPCIDRDMLSLGDKSQRLGKSFFSAASNCLGRLEKHFACLWICTEAVGTTRPFEHHEYEHDDLANHWHQT